MATEILDPQMAPPRFEPNSWAQERFLQSWVPELLYSGHRGSSKSRTICEKLDYLARRYPGANLVLARKKREHLGNTTLPILLDQVITPSHKAWGWRRSADGGSALYYPNKSKILMAGLDNPGRMLSGEWMAAYCDQAEELDEDEWIAIGGSLRQREDAFGNPIPFHQLGGACNPDGPAHFLFRRFRPDLTGHGGHYVTRTEEETVLLDGRTKIPIGRPTREVIVAGLKDNLENLPPPYQAWLASLTGRYRDRYVLGLWVAFEGYIFDNFDERIHVIDPPEEWKRWGNYPPPNWKRYRGIDFGYTNPFVCQWWTRSPDGTWYMYREIYFSHRLNSDHLATIKEQEARELHALNLAIHEDNEAGAYPERKILSRLSFSNTLADSESAEGRANLESLGLPSNTPVKDVEPGLQTVYEAMQPNKLPDGTVRAGLYLIRKKLSLVEEDPVLVAEGKPTCTAEEFPLYMRATRRATSKDVSDLEAPRKGHDHGIDACRYVLHTARISGEARVIRLTQSPRRY